MIVLVDVEKRFNKKNLGSWDGSRCLGCGTGYLGESSGEHYDDGEKRVLSWCTYAVNDKNKSIE